jgi:hypothetical protein
MFFLLFFSSFFFYPPPKKIRNEAAAIHDLAARQWGPGWVLDAGANIGVFSGQLCLVQPELPIVAVELDPKNFELLRINTAQLGPRCPIDGICAFLCGGAHC